MKQKIYYLDILRVLALLAVIFNHSWGYFSCDNAKEFYNTNIYYLDLFLNSLTRFNVPIFFMISGALLLENTKNLSLKKTFNRILNIAIPFIAWYAIYILFYYIKSNGTIFPNIFRLVYAPPYYAEHLWYIYALIPIYLLVPILIVIVKNSSKKLINYILGLWAVYSIVFPCISTFFPKFQISNNYSLNILSGYLGYFILGYKLSKTDSNLPYIKNILYIIILWILTFIGSLFYNFFYNKDFGYFYNFLAPNLVLLSINVFMLIKKLFKEKQENKSNLISKLISNICNLSFGIYLAHFLIKDLITLFIKNNIINPYLYLILAPILVFALSYIIIVSFSKIKYLSFIISGTRKNKASD